LEWGGGRERGRRMNKVQKCVHMYVNAKMIPVGIVPGIGGGGIKETSGGVKSSIIYLMHCKNPCKCHNISPTSTNNKGEKKQEKTLTFQLNGMCIKLHYENYNYNEYTEKM
jgi:hypothetical protein